MNELLDLLAFDGGSIKTLGDEGEFEGLAIPFKVPDLTKRRDIFTPETEFGRAMSKGSDVLYYHGLEKVGPRDLNPLAFTTIGETEFSIKTDGDDAGVWAKGQMHRRNAYELKVWEMVKAGKLGLSTGVASHRVRREANRDGTHTIKTWHIDELSFTPDPAHYRTKVYAIKSLLSEPEAPESEGFLESLKRAESALEWAIGRDLNAVKLDALKTLTESVKRYKDSQIDQAKLRSAFARSEKLLARYGG